MDRSDGKNKQAHRTVTETESREIIRNEIMRESATLQFSLYPKTLRRSEIIRFGLWRALQI